MIMTDSGTFLDQPQQLNSPANDYWTWYIEYSSQNETQMMYVPISFLPTGEVDELHTTNDDLVKAETLLTPSISYIANITGNHTIDFLKLLNFYFVSDYWLNLAKFGQIAPATYNYTTRGAPIFGEPIYFPPTNNIFVNNTLFQIYSSVLRDDIIPLLLFAWPEASLPPFLPLNEDNRLQLAPATIFRTYSCCERRLKGWFEAIISILVANYALLGGAYKIFIFLAGWIQKRRQDRGDYFTNEENTK
jgi:hypothetical protein